MNKKLLAGIGMAALVSACTSLLGDFQVGGDTQGTDSGAAVDAGAGADTGSNSGVAVLKLDRTSLDFGSITVGSLGAPAAFAVSNTGTAAVVVDTKLEGANAGAFVFATNDCAGRSLAPQALCVVQIKFGPTAGGAADAALVVSGGDARASAALSGTGVAPGAITLQPSPGSFGDVSVGGSSTTTTFTARNTGGTTTGNLAVQLTGTDRYEFKLVDDQCSNTTLAPNGECTIDLAFLPNSVGAKSASLTASAAPGGTGISPLSGKGVTGPALTVTPTPFDYQTVDVGATTPPVQAFTVKNTGGLATAALAVALGGQDPGQFEVVTGTSSCAGQTLAPAATCTVSVAFKPTSRDVKSARLEVTTGARGAPGFAQGVASLGGTGRDFVLLTVTKTSGKGGGTVTAAGYGIDCGGDCSEQIPRTDPTDPVVTLTANPDSTSEIGGWSVSGCGTSPTCDVTMSSAQTVDVTFNPLAPAALTVDVPSTDFGIVDLTTISNDVKVFTFTNTGDLPTSTLTVTLDGNNPGDFFLDSNNCTGSLNGGASCTVGVKFKPIAIGSRSALLKVAATTGGSVKADLIGIGRAYAVLSVFKSGAGSGAVSGTLDSTKVINCGLDCGENVPRTSATTDPVVTLTATPVDTSYFSGWSSSVTCGNNPTCDVTMSGDKQVTAFFEQRPDTIITASSVPVVYVPSASVSFTSTLTGASFKCSVNGGTPFSCTSPFQYTFTSSPSTVEIKITAAVGPVEDLSPAVARVTYTTDRPLLYYDFEDPTARLKNTGTSSVTGGTETSVTYETNRFGSSIRFDGTLDTKAVLTGTASVIGGSSVPDWTIEFWFKEDSPLSFAGYFDTRNATAGGWQSYHGSGTSGTAAITTCGGNPGSCGTFATPTLGQWHHLLYRFAPGTSTTAPLEIFVDGAPVVTLATGTYTSSQMKDITLGNFAGGSFPSKLLMDEVKVYNKVFTNEGQCTQVIGGVWDSGTSACTRL